jgi:hypothetical protein
MGTSRNDLSTPPPIQLHYSVSLTQKATLPKSKHLKSNSGHPFAFFKPLLKMGLPKAVSCFFLIYPHFFYSGGGIRRSFQRGELRNYGPWGFFNSPTVPMTVYHWALLSKVRTG